MHIKYLKKKNIDYSSILYNRKSYSFQKIIHVIKIENLKFSYKSYSIFIHMLSYLLSLVTFIHQKYFTSSLHWN